MTTLVTVELRKMVDTRAGRWLLVGVGAVLALVLVVALATGNESDRAFSNLVVLAQFPLSILIPVLGVLAATSEWGQRTVLTTFALVPSRSRVVAAKVLAAMALALATAAFSILVAAVAALIAPAFGAVDSDWSLPIGDVLQLVVFQELNMLLGVALGTLLLNSGLAIVLYFVLPTVWSGLTDSISGLADAQKWLDTSTTWIHLIDPDATLTGTSWAQAGTTALLWIVLPLGLGIARILRREVD
jgi:ABC-type transport system involved in multi-copper enzyme maturation permease subunit